MLVVTTVKKSCSAAARALDTTTRLQRTVVAAIDRLQNGLNRIQAETDAWAGEPLEA